jgi:sugar phosphate isomerase/epimerase
MILGLADHPSLEATLKDFLTFATKLKANVVELRLDRLELLSAFSYTQKILEIKSVLDGYDFRYFVHAPSIDVNLASLNATLRNAAEKTVKNAVEFAAKINAELVVSHVGRLSRDYSQELGEKSMKNATASLKRINQFSNDLGIIFTIENDHKSRDYVLAGYPEQVNFLVENVGCKLTFDVGHANTLGKPEEFVSSLEKHIVNIHLHDNSGTEDSHLPLGNGIINFEDVFKKIGNNIFNLPLTVECHSFPELEKSVDFVRQKLDYL